VLLAVFVGLFRAPPGAESVDGEPLEGEPLDASPTVAEPTT
jgi:hypothetical protein